MEKKKFFTAPLPLLFYLALWEAVSIIVDEPVLFPGFFDVAKEVVSLLSDEEFYVSSINTCLKVLQGFFFSFTGGSLLACLSYKNKTVRSFSKIPLMLMKSVPVAAYIIMLFMWLPSAKIPPAIAFIAVFPIVYNNIYAYLGKRDKKLEEMAEVFNIKGLKKLIYISFPEAFPFVKASVRTGLAVSFKASVAAEVITIAGNTIGENFYNSKIYFDMTGLLAWTFALLVMTTIIEKLALLILDKCLKLSQEGMTWI